MTENIATSLKDVDAMLDEAQTKLHYKMADAQREMKERNITPPPGFAVVPLPPGASRPRALLYGGALLVSSVVLAIALAVLRATSPHATMSLSVYAVALITTLLITSAACVLLRNHHTALLLAAAVISAVVAVAAELVNRS